MSHAVDKDKLVALYTSNAAARLMLDRWAAKTKPARRSTVDKQLEVLPGLGRKSIVRVLRDLADAGCGRFLVGRRTSPSRLQWSVDSIVAAKLASGMAPAPPTNGAPPVEMVEHRFQLRAREFVSFRLPLDLTPAEASRLADYIKTLPIGTP